MKTFLIICEKPKQSALIASALTDIDDDVAAYRYNDKFRIFDSNGHKQFNSKATTKNGKPMYYDDLASRYNDNRLENFSIQIQQQDSANGPVLRRRKSATLEEALEERRINLQENIIYYAIPYNGVLYLICDTNGVMISENIPFQFRKRLIEKNTTWNQVSSLIELCPESPAGKIRAKESTLFRTAWFDTVLTERKLPCKYKHHQPGKKLQIEGVICATDYDIAGQFIFQCVIDYCNKRLPEKSQINDNQLLSLDLSHSDTRSIRKAVANPISYNKTRALAGKLRSSVDTLYGLTGQLFFKAQQFHPTYANWFTEHFSKGKRTRKPYNLFSFGRVQSLALHVLIERYIDLIDRTGPSFSLYELYPGKLSAEKLIQEKNKGNFLELLITEEPTALSQAVWLEACKEVDVGTHTTRYGQLKKLQENKYAHLVDGAVLPTTLGLSLYQILTDYLLYCEGGVLVTNSELISAMEEIKLNNYEKGHDIFTSFMSRFYSTFRSLYQELENSESFRQAVHGVLGKVISGDIPIKYRSKFKNKKELTIQDNAEFTKPDDGNLYGLTDCIDESQVNELYENPDSPYIVKRFNEKKVQFDPKEFIRRICCIKKGIDFVIHTEYPNAVFNEIADDDWTVLKLQDHNGEIEAYMSNRECYMASTAHTFEVTKAIEQTIEESSDCAHPSLSLNGISRRSLAGEDSLKLALEYSLPWCFNAWCIEIEKAGENCLSEIYYQRKPLKQSFISKMLAIIFKKERHSENDKNLPESIQFKVVNRYTVGEVHDFESVLATMSDKYEISFERTAYLAEELYLN